VILTTVSKLKEQKHLKCKPKTAAMIVKSFMGMIFESWPIIPESARPF
jgi:hypothetical protein